MKVLAAYARERSAAAEAEKEPGVDIREVMRIIHVYRPTEAGDEAEKS